ncbi:MAG: hypothetical protein HQM11_12380 [SAR324 cluster bacterium]|nr:hypothetical protein [SAR324 cluster bacterium]
MQIINRLKQISAIALIIGSYLAFSPLAWSKANFTVAPGIVEFDLSRPGTQTFLLINSGDENIRLFIRPLYFEIDSRSLAAGVHLRSLTAEEEDISSVILVSPRVLALIPGERRNIRISVRPNRTLTPGDYRAHLLIKTLGDQKTAPQPTDSQQQGMSIKLDISLETAVAVYGRIGNPEFDFQWECQTTQEGKLQINAINLSKWRYSGWVAVYDVSNMENPLAKQRLISLRESKRPIMFDFSPPEKMEIRWGTGEAKQDEGKSQCSISK